MCNKVGITVAEIAGHEEQKDALQVVWYKLRNYLANKCKMQSLVKGTVYIYIYKINTTLLSWLLKPENVPVPNLQVI